MEGQIPLTQAPAQGLYLFIDLLAIQQSPQ
jgi:hypothetical protein